MDLLEPIDPMGPEAARLRDIILAEHRAFSQQQQAAGQPVDQLEQEELIERMSRQRQNEHMARFPLSGNLLALTAVVLSDIS